MFLCLELPSLLSCGNFVSVYAWERARCFRNFPICAQCDFYKAIKLILGKSAPENSDPWDLKEPVKADRDGKMMTEPSWLKWLWGGSCFSAHPPAHPCFLPLPLPFSSCSGWVASSILLLIQRALPVFLAVAGWDLRLGPRSRGLRSQPGSSHKASSGLRVFVVKLGCDLSQAVPTDEDPGF